MGLKTNGVPMWATGIAILFGVFSTLAGLAIMFDPSIMNIDDTVVGRQWAGRNIGLGVVLLVAVALRDSRAYLAGFAGGVFRDIGDLVGAVEDGSSTVVPIVALVVTLIAIAGVVRAGGLTAATTGPTAAPRSPQSHAA